MNLDILSVSPITQIQLKHPVTGDNIDNGIVKCYASHTPEYRKAALLVAKNHSKDKTENWQELDDEKLLAMVDQTDAFTVDLLCKIITNHEFELNGKPVKNVRDILDKPAYFWIAEQIKQEIDKGTVFIQE